MSTNTPHNPSKTGVNAHLGPSALPAIPQRDVREGGALRHATEARDQALALRDDCLTFLPTAARYLVPALDSLTRRWLRRTSTPYLAEIEGIATTLGFPGVWFLNGSYEWGCTTHARDAGTPWLLRTLDWPFPGLGRHLEIARMAGPAGEFYNATWPGFVGVMTAMAPGRFSASINQAPLWRRTRHPWLRLYDVAANAVSTWSIRHVPPDHLLRHVFETCTSYADAKARLETTPIARPVIFTLAGTRPGERCVIERTEEGFSTRTEQTGAANDWLEPVEPWEARVGGDLLFNCDYLGARANSRDRREALAAWSGSPEGASFAWVVPPVLNKFTRLAAEMCAAQGIMRLVGYEHVPGASEAEAVTQVCEVIAPPESVKVAALAS
jgi:hypothetical protein